jgi:hypothetical protein
MLISSVKIRVSDALLVCKLFYPSLLDNSVAYIKIMHKSLLKEAIKGFIS